MSVDQIAAEALRLSEKERAGLASRLLRSLPPVAFDDDEGVAEALRRLREETEDHPQAHWQIAPEQGQFLHVLARAIGAARTLEVGVFMGYSSTWVALALPPDGVDHHYAPLAVIKVDSSVEVTVLCQQQFQPLPPA